MDKDTKKSGNDVPAERRQYLRREYPRLNTLVDVEYTKLKKRPLQRKETTIKNVGAGGICLIVYENVEVGSILNLKFHLSDINRDLEAKGRVIWSASFEVGPDGRERHDLGIEFTEIDESVRQNISQHILKLMK